MKISIIIPVINEMNIIETSIDRAKELAVDEILYVDGGSTDGTAETIQRAGLKVIACRPGRGFQLRAGAAKASGNLLLFLHADNGLHPASILQIRELGAKPTDFWGGFKQKIEQAGLKYRLLEWGNQIRVRRFGLVYGDQGLFVSRRLYEQVGGFPVQPIMEDFEISLRLNRMAPPILLPGPHYVSARRWNRRGVLRQTLLNWSLVSNYQLGASAELLNSRYRRHDQGS